MDLQRMPNGRPARNRAVGTMCQGRPSKKRAPGLVLHDEDEFWFAFGPCGRLLDLVDGGPNRGDIANRPPAGKGNGRQNHGLPGAPDPKFAHIVPRVRVPTSELGHSRSSASAPEAVRDPAINISSLSLGGAWPMISHQQRLQDTLQGALRVVHKLARSERNKTVW